PKASCFEQGQAQVQRICDQLAKDAGAQIVSVMNKDGHEIARTGAPLDSLQLELGHDFAFRLSTEREFTRVCSANRIRRLTLVAGRALLVIVATESAWPGFRDLEAAAGKALQIVFTTLADKMGGGSAPPHRDDGGTTPAAAALAALVDRPPK